MKTPLGSWARCARCRTEVLSVYHAAFDALPDGAAVECETCGHASVLRVDDGSVYIDGYAAVQTCECPRCVDARLQARKDGEA